MPELYELSMRDTSVVVDEKMETHHDQGKTEDKIERIQTQHSACYSIA